MSSVAYIATPKVRHLAAWTADDISRDDIGRNYRVLCGRHSHGLLITPDVATLPEWLDPAWSRRFEAAMRRPLCKGCVAVLQSLTDLGGGA